MLLFLLFLLFLFTQFLFFICSAFSPRHQESAAFMQRLSSAREALAEKIREARSENEEWRSVEQNPNIIDFFRHVGSKTLHSASQCNMGSHMSRAELTWIKRRFKRRCDFFIFFEKSSRSNQMSYIQM